MVQEILYVYPGMRTGVQVSQTTLPHSTSYTTGQWASINICLLYVWF